MYWKDTFILPNTIEYEFKHVGKYGAKGEKRAPKKKATPEQIRKQNQANRVKKMRRLIEANFNKSDLWICLKYPKGTRKSVDEFKEDVKKFLNKLRKEYRKRQKILKFILRMEVGKNGGMHAHILINRAWPGIDAEVQDAWEQQGNVNFTPLYKFGEYKDLASYIVKQPDESIMKQLSMFEVNEQKHFIKYSSSRNLIRPAPERTYYKRRTLKKLIEEGPTATPGYYIDRDSIYHGVNPYTGYSYYHYTEIRITTGRDSPQGGFYETG